MLRKNKFRGVSCIKGKYYWAKAIVNKEHIYLGMYRDGMSAALAYDNYVRENKLDRRLNFPDPEPENLIPNTRLIRLTKGEWAIVDEEDYERINKYFWHVKKTKYGCYAVSNTKGCGGMMYMHKEVLNTKKEVDHKNRNGIHNYKSNLRECPNHSYNEINKPPMENKSSKFKGVSWHSRDLKWTCCISFMNIVYHLGYFDSEIDAAMAYDKKAYELFGEWAYLNFPDEIK